MHDENPYGDMDDLQLADLGDAGGSGPGGAVGAPASELGDEFADASLDSAPPDASYGDVDGIGPGADGGGLELDAPATGDVKVRGLATKPEAKPLPSAPALETRGATGVGAVVPTGATPAGHRQQRRGLFFPFALENALASFIVGLVVALLPARVVSASHLDSVGVEAALESMEQGHAAIASLLDPERIDEGPQSVDAVAAALNDEVRAIDETAAEVEAAVASAKSRYWIVWGGIGLPLGLALSLLRRR